MTEISVLSDLLLLLGLALGSAWLSRRLHQSPIVGYLLTGMVFGPFGLHLLGGLHEVETLAEVGVILLLFTIGLEFPLPRILRQKRLMFASGTLQVVLTALAVFAVCRAAGLPATSATVLAMALALSSTAIVLKLLLEQGELDAPQGKVAVAILLFQDLCAVLFLALLPLLAGRSGALTPLSALRAAALLTALVLFARFLLHPLIRAVVRTRTPELFRLSLLALVLGTAWVTAQAGLSLPLGAFLAGLFLAESDYSHQALADILPFRDTFLALFFVSMGMLVDLGQLTHHWVLILSLAGALTLVKTLGATAGAALSSYPLRIALLVGLLLFQVGEFSFVLLREALKLQIISPEIYQGALSLAVLSMIATPLAARWAPAVAARLAAFFQSAAPSAQPSLEEKTANLKGHVIIAGYGHSGRNVGQILRQMRLPHVFVELNGDAVRQGLSNGDFITYGDATSSPVLAALGATRARALVLAINDPSALCRAIRAGRELSPELFILARTRFVAELDRLRDLGADEIIPDELEAGLQLSAVLLRRFGVTEGRVLQLLAPLRQEHYAHLRQPQAAVDGRFSLLSGGELDFQAVPDDSPCLGKSLAELAFRTRTGAMVAGVIRGEGTLYSPPADFTLERGDTLILLAATADLLRARDFLSPPPSE